MVVFPFIPKTSFAGALEPGRTRGMLYLGGEYPPQGAPADKRGIGLIVSEVHAIEN